MDYHIYYTKDDADNICIFEHKDGLWANPDDFLVQRRNNGVKLFRVFEENYSASETEVALLLELARQPNLLQPDGVTRIQWIEEPAHEAE